MRSRWVALGLAAVLWCRGTFGDAATEPAIQIFNIHVDEYATKAVVTWETNVRTDTKVRFGRTAQYEDLRANPEQLRETIHSITLDGLRPDTTYHYQIDAQGKQAALKSEDLTFHTSKEDALGDAQGKENAGLVNLTKSYVDKLTRMTPDEREKLKTSIQKFTDPGAPDPKRRGDQHGEFGDNPFLLASQERLSTFSIDVDTASYAIVRRHLESGRLPPREAVRIEELINTFTYTYPAPDPGETLTAHAEVAACPWEPRHKLLKVGMKGQEVRAEERPASNLVFLIDVSGSMNQPDRLPLVIRSLELLIPSLRAQDRVSLAVYAGRTGVVLPATPGDRKEVLREALNRLRAGGSTNGAAGLALAYEVAQGAFIKDGVNRVILCTDGDFNVGMTGIDELERFVAERAKGGVFLSVLGFGMGNLNDKLAERIADRGNGNYAYIDGIGEARKVLVQQAGGTLHAIAKDVKLQLEFNPQAIAGYRLIGYENRVMEARDFHDDTKDAGDLGAGHTVTALYELVPVEKPQGGLAVIKLRYKQPTADASRMLEFRVGDVDTAFEKASVDMRFAAAVASFGMLLRGSPHKGSSSWDGIAAMAENALGPDEGRHRHDFFALVNRARYLSGAKSGLSVGAGPGNTTGAVSR